MLRARLPGRYTEPLTWLLGFALAAIAAAVVARLPLREVGTLGLLSAVALLAAAASGARQRALIVIGATIFVVGLNWTYVDWVVPLYGYSGLIDSRPDWLVLAVTTGIALVPALWLPGEAKRPSDIIVWILFLFGYVPATTIPIYMLGPELTSILPLSLTLLIAFAVLGAMAKIPRKHLPFRGLSWPVYERLLLGVSIVGGIYMIAVFGLPSQIPGFEKVYDVRLLFGATERSSAGSGYVVPWMGNVILTLLIAVGLGRSRIRLVLLGTAGELFVYSLTGYKSVLFAVVLVPLIYFVVRHARPRFGTSVISAAVTLLALSVAGTAATNSPWPLALFAHRLLSVPGQLTSYFYEFFASHATYALSHSFLRWFTEAPYDVDSPFLIASVFLHSPATSANANIWADSIANFGLLGVIPFTAVLGLTLWALDSAAYGKNLPITAAAVGLAGISLSNSALFTSIVTLGIALTIVFVALMPQEIAWNPREIHDRLVPDHPG